MLTPATVHALLDEHGLHPKRSLGQNFLADPNTARRIVAARGRCRRPRRCSRSGPGSARSPSRCSTPATTSSRSSSTSSLAAVLRPSVAGDGRRRAATRVRVEHGDAMTRRPRRAARPAPSTVVGVRVEPAVQRGGAGRRAPARGGRRGRAHPGDGAAGGGRAPGRRARRRAVRRGVGEGRVLRRRRRWWGWCRRRCSCPGPRSTRRWCACDRRAGAAGERAVGRRPVHAGPGGIRPAAQDAAPLAACRCSATAPLACSTGRGHRAHGRGPSRSGSTSGRRWPRSGGGRGRVRLARVRATAYPKLNLSLRVLGRRADGYHDLESLVVSLGQPHDVARGVRGAGARRRAGGGRRASRWARTIPSDHRNLAFIAAEKLLVRAGRSGHGVRLVLRKHIPAGGGLGGGSADAAAALLAVRELLDVDIDDAGVLRARGRGRVRRAVLRAGRRGLDARPGRDHRTGRGADGAGVRRGHPAVPAVDARRLQGVGQARRSALASARCPRPDGSPHLVPELVNDLEPAAEALEPRLREFRAALEARRGRAGAARGQRLGLRGAGRRRAAAARASVDAGSRRLRVPVVGTTSVSRGVRLAELTAPNARSGAAVARSSRARRRQKRRGRASGPAAGAASASSSEASCASSSACACGAS